MGRRNNELSEQWYAPQDAMPFVERDIAYLLYDYFLFYLKLGYECFATLSILKKWSKVV
jgi:hypothetical protein